MFTRFVLYSVLGMRGYSALVCASLLVRSSPDRVVWVRALAGDIVLCSWARHLTLTVPLSTQGRVVRKPGNANPGLKVNRSIYFFSTEMFSTSCVLCGLRLFKLKTEEQAMYAENLPEKLQNWNQNCRQSWVSLIGPWTTLPRAGLFESRLTLTQD